MLGPIAELAKDRFSNSDDTVHIQCSDDLIMNRNLGLKNEERERRIEKICGVMRGTDFREEIN